MTVDDEARLVEFKLILARLVQDYVRSRLAATARQQRRRLPKQADVLLRTGALAAVARLNHEELAAFAQSDDWDQALSRSVASGAWSRLVANALHYAFKPQAA